jgi:hypothetical protein
MNQILTLTLLWLGLGLASEARSEQLLRGIGAYQFGYRSYDVIGDKFGSSRDIESLGSPFSKSFDTEGMLKGDPSSELYQLANEISRYGDPALSESLTLGSLAADIEARSRAQILGLAYGLGRGWMVQIGYPIVDVSIKTKLSLTGENNAQSIAQSLGELAYDELQTGLAKASALSVNMIEENIKGLGYQDIKEWKYHGPADTVIRGEWTAPRRLWGRATYGGKGTIELSLPTGHFDDPDALTDVSVGRGTERLRLNWANRLNLRRGYFLRSGVDVAYSVPFQRRMRVSPTANPLVDRSNIKKVGFYPGSESGLLVGSGWKGFWWSFDYSVHSQVKLADRYTDMSQQTASLYSKDSFARRTSHQLHFQLNTANAYQRRRAKIPVVVDLSWQKTLTGQNQTPEDFIQISVTSFFRTPWSALRSH